MSMSPVEVERKVGQLDNDVQAINTMPFTIQGNQERHTLRLGELAGMFDTLQTTVDGLDAKLDAMEIRLEGRLDALDDKLDAVIELLRSGPSTAG